MTPAAGDAIAAGAPPLASSLHRARDWLASLAFVGTIAAMGVAAFAPHDAAKLDAENRALAAWPSRFAADWRAHFERAFADRFGARDALLRLHNHALVRAFGVSPAHNVLIGRGGWLYFKGEEGTTLDRDYRGVRPFPDADVARVVHELERRARFLAAHGIAYVVTVAPDKATIYPEYLPAWVTRSKAPSPLDRLAAALRADDVVHFVDLRAPLRAAKAKERVYYMTDSHWNYHGARVAYDELMRALAQALAPMPVTPAPVHIPGYVPGLDVYRGDLARMTGDANHFGEPDIASLGKILATPKSRCAQRVDAGDTPGVERYACDRPGLLPGAIVYRDSMAIPLIPMLSENFGTSTYISGHALDPAFVLRERPTAVIEEMVERAIIGPAATPMPPS
jgi:hypothetical protein